MIGEESKLAAAEADTTDITLMRSSMGNKTDALTLVVGATYSALAYLKGILTLAIQNRKLGYTGSATYPAAPSVAETDVHESAVPTSTTPLAYSGFSMTMRNCTSLKTIRVYKRVDGTNYDLAETLVWRVGDPAVVPINVPDTARQWKVTVQTTATEAVARAIPYEYVKEG